MVVKAGPALHSTGRRSTLRYLAALGSLACCADAALAGDEPPRVVAVAFPVLAEPFRSLFNAVIDGVEERLKARVLPLPLDGSPPPDWLKDLRRRDVQGLIALGRQGLRLAASVDKAGLSMVAGCVLSVPPGEMPSFPVLSLAPDPALLFARLRALMPAVKRVVSVYDPAHNAWLMRLAQDAGRAQGIDVQLSEATDLRSSIRMYREAMQSLDGRRDAIWLPQDATTVEESAVLPFVLGEAWNLGVPVFSSSVTHVRRGALFALYPDPLELGHALADTLLAQMAANATAAHAAPLKGVQPLKEVLLAVNTRTARHLGLNPAASSLRFNLVFPEP